MENKSLLTKIKSKYIIEKIISYIKDNYYICKIFNYSKYFQKKFGLELLYLEQFVIKRIKLSNYFHNSYIHSTITLNELKEKLNKELEKYDINNSVIQDIIMNYYKKYPIKEPIREFKEFDIDIDETDTSIEFCTPFFDSLSKLEDFGKIFILYINFKLIQKYNLEDKYIKKFEILHKSNKNLSSIELRLRETNDLNCLKKFKINFNQIKNLFIKDNLVKKLNDNIFEKLFSFFSIKNNLIHLELRVSQDSIEPSLFEGINSFTSLKYLFILSLKFKGIFVFKLYNLEKLKLTSCENIAFEENSLLNLKSIDLDQTLIITNNPLKFPNLEEISLIDRDIDDYISYISIIDFKSLINLKKFYGQVNYFLLLKDTLLEEVYLLYQRENSIDIEKELIEKLLEIKTLKDIHLNSIEKITDKLISDIKGKNYSVTSIYINWLNEETYCKLDNFQMKFPNLRKFEINNWICRYEKNDEKLEIKEDKNSKINNLYIEAGWGSHIYFCLSEYDKLESIKLNFGKIINNNLPFFDKNNKIIFNSLINLDIEIDVCKIIIDNTLMNTLFNNIVNIPNLEHLKLAGCLSDNINNYSYLIFIKKILNLKSMKKLILIYLKIKQIIQIGIPLMNLKK